MEEYNALMKAQEELSRTALELLAAQQQAIEDFAARLKQLNGCSESQFTVDETSDGAVIVTVRVFS